MQTPNSGDPAPGSARGGSGGTGEFVAIEAIKATFEAAARALDPSGQVPPVGQTWIGDDAAVVALTEQGAEAEPLLLTTDLVVEGVHVDLTRGTVADAGYKALTATVSDLAAMGARPRYALVSVAAPAGTDLVALGTGLAEAATDCGCVVVGGDLSQSPCLVVSVAALGTLSGEEPTAGPLLRSGAEPGDQIFVTGPLGASAAGRRALEDGSEVAGAAAIVLAHRRPTARIAEGERARVSGASAAVDVSDGLATDARHLARASGVGLVLADIPVAPGATRDDAIGGGEDYELVITTSRPERLLDQFDRAGLRAPLPIGVCTADPGELILDGRPLPPAGWEHRF